MFGTQCGGSFAACSPASNTLSLPYLNGANGVEFDGVAANAYTGYSVAAGDINGDGITDLIIGAPGSPPTIFPSHIAKVYVYFGHKTTTLDPWPTSAFNLGGL